MVTNPDIRVLRDRGAQKHLEKFTAEARAGKNPNAWRCLHCRMHGHLIKEPARRDIAVQFLRQALAEADEARAYWLASGHLFIFFQGQVRTIIKNFEHFLDVVDDHKERPQYHFFWELSRFWGYFDQVLFRVLGESPFFVVDAGPRAGVKGKGKTKPAMNFQKELHAQRRQRYKPLLLIVEDDRTTRHFLQAIMERYCDITIAWNVEQARRSYKEMLPNMAFLDIMLPDGNGQNLAEEFCQSDPDAFVVMISGSISNEVVERCQDLGVKGFIAKPVQEDRLLHFVNVYHQLRKESAGKKTKTNSALL
ncbi:MAG: response regulator [Alphaproteobacteria bacterium]|nr:response regulator [Alphaproteobacteria bacterium]